MVIAADIKIRKDVYLNSGSCQGCGYPSRDDELSEEEFAAFADEANVHIVEVKFNSCTVHLRLCDACFKEFQYAVAVYDINEGD